MIPDTTLTATQRREQHQPLAPLTEYELERERNIQRNAQEMRLQLGLPDETPLQTENENVTAGGLQRRRRGRAADSPSEAAGPVEEPRTSQRKKAKTAKTALLRGIGE